MRLEKPDTKPNRRPGRGYKIVEKKEDRYYSWDHEPNRGLEYRMGEWQTDPNDGLMIRPVYTWAYPTGYHVGLSLAAARQVLARLVSSRYHDNLVIIECSYRKVVASEMSDRLWDGTKVAREIKLIREVQ